MRRHSWFLLALAALLAAALLIGALYLFLPGSLTAEELQSGDFQEGDIIFQPSVSSQSLAIQIATRSKYSHCGIIAWRNGQPYVLEAIATVSLTPLLEWINRGVSGHYVLMRLKDPSPLTPEALAAMRKDGEAMLGKPYDRFFQWSDDSIYCSELVWKIYERGAGITLVPLRAVRDYNLEDKVVMDKIRERFGDKLRLDEPVTAPSDLMASPLLEVVGGN